MLTSDPVLAESVLFEIGPRAVAYMASEEFYRHNTAGAWNALTLFYAAMAQAADEAEHRLWMQTECAAVYDEGRGELW